MKKTIFISILVVALFIVVFPTSASNQAQCFGDCAMEWGICQSHCDGDGECLGNCAAAHGRCVARCH
jgi:hypothetical protein